MSSRAGWQSGYATACKAVYDGSIPYPRLQSFQSLQSLRSVRALRCLADPCASLCGPGASRRVFPRSPSFSVRPCAVPFAVPLRHAVAIVLAGMARGWRGSCSQSAPDPGAGAPMVRFIPRCDPPSPLNATHHWQAAADCATVRPRASCWPASLRSREVRRRTTSSHVVRMRTPCRASMANVVHSVKRFASVYNRQRWRRKSDP